MVRIVIDEYFVNPVEMSVEMTVLCQRHPWTNRSYIYILRYYSLETSILVKIVIWGYVCISTKQLQFYLSVRAKKVFLGINVQYFNILSSSRIKKLFKILK